MTKKRTGRFAPSKSRRQNSPPSEAPQKTRVPRLHDHEDWEATAAELQARLERVDEWLDRVQQRAPEMDTQAVIIPRSELLLLRGILDDVVELEADGDDD